MQKSWFTWKSLIILLSASDFLSIYFRLHSISTHRSLIRRSSRKTKQQMASAGGTGVEDCSIQ